MQLSRIERAALRDFAARVRARFGERVRRVALFGSRARGDVHAESDIDVCVEVEGLTWQEKHEVYGITAAILDDHEVLLSSFVVSAEHMEHLRKRERAIAEEIARDGVPL